MISRKSQSVFRRRALRYLAVHIKLSYLTLETCIHHFKWNTLHTNILCSWLSRRALAAHFSPKHWAKRTEKKTAIWNNKIKINASTYCVSQTVYNMSHHHHHHHHQVICGKWRWYLVEGVSGNDDKNSIYTSE